MLADLSLLAELFAYILLARTILRTMRGRGRDVAFAALNLAGVFYFFFKVDEEWIVFVAYIGFVCFQYAVLRFFVQQGGWKPWIAFFTPILALILVRYLPMSFYLERSGALRTLVEQKPEFTVSALFVGLSYLAFRSSYLVLEIRNGSAAVPDLWRYLGFCFFLPTMPVGPINHYQTHRQAFEDDPPSLPWARSGMRILVGMVKFQFLGSVFNQLTYSGLMLDNYSHPWTDLPIAAVFYYLYLYCNFSGYCDMAIGVGGLIGVPVAENFQDPFAARNIKDFWNRWHITLSSYMRDVVFSPLSKYLARLLGPARVNHAVALTIMAVFLLVGIWHGVGWNYAVFGAIHGLGVVANHYYTIFLKKRLGRERFKAYNENPWIRAVAVVLTFAYVAFSMFFFANTPAEMQELLGEIG